MWPKERTAILVIHGMGQQDPFETLDSWVRGLWENARSGGATIKAEHRVRMRGEWIENCVRLIKGGDEKTAIDCFEYYWAHKTQRKTNYRQVFEWLLKAGEEAQRFYQDNMALVEKYEENKSGVIKKVGKSRRFDKYWYLKYGGKGLRLVYTLMPVLGWLVQRSKLAMLVVSQMGRLGRSFVVDSIGDVTVYTASDMKSQHYEVRKAVLDGAVEQLEWLLRQPEYLRVIVVGHSLGSVVAYDAMNRMNSRMNAGIVDPKLAGKMKGFVSLGSPLDKIAFFLRERERHTFRYVRRQIINQLYGFKAKSLDPAWMPPRWADLENRIEPLLNEVRWLNFWDKNDPISGPLDFYEQVENTEVDTGAGLFKAHSAYWGHPPVQEAIVRRLLAAEG